MEVFLLQDVPGVGKKNDLLIVGDGYAMNYLLPRRAALVATPVVRKRYAEFIRRRAEEREQERASQQEIATNLADKMLVFKKKATKAGKLYGAITEKDIVQALKEQLSMDVSEDAVRIDTPIKALGTAQIMLQMGERVVTVNVKVEVEKA